MLLKGPLCKRQRLNTSSDFTERLQRKRTLQIGYIDSVRRRGRLGRESCELHFDIRQTCPHSIEKVRHSIDDVCLKILYYYALDIGDAKTLSRKLCKFCSPRAGVKEELFAGACLAVGNSFIKLPLGQLLRYILSILQTELLVAKDVVYCS